MLPENVYVTVTGFSNFYGIKVFKIGRIIKLIKDRSNDYDSEAVAVELSQLGRAGYISNSVSTKAGGTRSAGFIYNLFDEYCYAEVMFTTRTKVIARIVATDRDSSRVLEKYSVYF